MRRGLLSVLVILCVASTGRADPLRLSAQDVVARALANNLDLRASRKDVSVAQASLERSLPWLPSNPAFTAGAQHATGFAPNYSFSLSQEFEIAGQRGARVDAARKEVEKANWDVKTAEQNLAANARTAFLRALVNIERVTAARQSVDASTALLRDLERRTTTPDTQRIGLNQARIQALRDTRAVAWAEHTRDTTLGALRSLLGLPADQEIVLIGAPRSEVRPLPSDAELTARALERRSDLIALRQAVEHANLHLALTRREGIPNVTLSGTFGRFESDNFAGGDITVPIPVFQRRAPEMHEALAEYERSNLQVQTLERDAAKEVREARQACVLTGDDLSAYQRQILPLSEENLAIERRLFERGTADTADVVGQQADLLTARLGYLDALEAYNTALIELERVSGGNLEAE